MRIEEEKEEKRRKNRRERREEPVFATATESQCSLMKPASVTISRRRSNCEYL